MSRWSAIGFFALFLLTSSCKSSQAQLTDDPISPVGYFSIAVKLDLKVPSGYTRGPNYPAYIDSYKQGSRDYIDFYVVEPTGKKRFLKRSFVTFDDDNTCELSVPVMSSAELYSSEDKWPTVLGYYFHKRKHHYFSTKLLTFELSGGSEPIPLWMAAVHLRDSRDQLLSLRTKDTDGESPPNSSVGLVYETSDIEKAIQKSHEEICSLQKELKSSSESISRLVSRADALDQKNAKLNQELASLRKDADSTKTMLLEVSKEKDSLKARVDELQKLESRYQDDTWTASLRSDLVTELLSDPVLREKTIVFVHKKYLDQCSLSTTDPHLIIIGFLMTAPLPQLLDVSFYLNTQRTIPQS